MTWFTKHDLTPDELAALEYLELATNIPTVLQSWNVVLSNGRMIAVQAAQLSRGQDDTLMAGRRPVCQPGTWLLFTPNDREVRTAKMARVTRPSAKKPKRSEAEKAEDALLVWQKEQDSKPGAMYGRVLRSDSEFASGQNEELYVYERGVYVPAKQYVAARLQDLADDRWSRHLHNETIAWLLGSAPGLQAGLAPNVINVRNGILVWKGNRWRLQPHSPELRTTIQLPVTFDPDAECPLYDKFISTSMPDEDTRNFLDEWMGYNLTSDYGHQKALMLGGREGSGKSQYLLVLEHLLGQRNVTSSTLQAIGENKWASADLYCKLANICADISSNELRMTSTFKALTGGDLIRGERKFKDAFEFHNVAKLSFSANEIPATRDATQAFFDRWFVVKFPRKFRGTDKQRENIGLAIAGDPAEMSGVLNRALAALTRLRRSGSFTMGDAMSLAHDEFRRVADTVAMFLADYLASGNSPRSRKEHMFQSYRAWCDANNHQPLSSTRFYPRLREWTPTGGISVQVTHSKGFEYFAVRPTGVVEGS
jgi:P4 family phage/plasmid primase-like protien